jgi:RNA polymerase sigma factor (sigma-70 family)
MNSEYHYTDSNLIGRCRNGESKAQFILFRKYSKAMYNIAIRFTNNHMDAEDILQESFITAFEKLPELLNPSTFPGWLKRIVINKCIDQVRKNRLVFDDLDDNLPDENYSDDEPDFTIDPAIVHNSIKNLPQGGRTILVLHVLEGYKHREIAGMLGITESTSKTQYSRALKLLNRELKQKIYVT